ncbi:MAG: hypothetical protein HQ556_12300 [Candidatus Marinimicrobia bacterium]|nr:hypothetical protein [Candidatus Neomarinimicrobiota bacterium]
MRTKNQIVKKRLQTTWLLLAWVAGSAQAGQSWSLATSMSYNQGTYVYENTIENYYLNLGVRYKQPLWSIAVTLPILAQQDNLELASFPESGVADSNGVLTNTHWGNVKMGVGDLYIFGQRTVWQNFKSKSSLSATFQFKVPLGFSSQTFSSQKKDYGAGILFKQYRGDYSFFTDLGYLVLGNPEWGIYKNPISYGAGIGRTFLRKTLSMSMYYRAYTEIIDGISPPQQISFGLYGRLNRQSNISINWTQGLSESSPDRGISMGLSRKL